MQKKLHNILSDANINPGDNAIRIKKSNKGEQRQRTRNSNLRVRLL